MKRAFILAALVLCGFVALEASAQTGKEARQDKQRSWQEGGMRHHREGGFGHGDGLAQLNLSQSQKDRIASVRESHQKDLIQKQADLKLARLDFHKLLRADRPNKHEINAQIDRMASIRADLMKLQVDQRLEVREILTPDQRAKLREGRGHREMKSDEAPPRNQDPRRM